MNGDKPSHHPGLIPALQYGVPNIHNVIPNTAVEGQQYLHPGNVLYAHTSPTHIPAFPNLPSNAMRLIKDPQPPFRASYDINARPQFVGRGCASTATGPVNLSVMLSGRSMQFPGASGAVRNPTLNGSVELFDQGQFSNPGSSSVPQHNCPPQMSAAMFNAVRGLSSGPLPIGHQNINGLMRPTQVAQRYDFVNTNGCGVSGLHLVDNLSALPPQPLGYPNVSGNVLAKWDGGTDNEAGNKARAPVHVLPQHPNAGAALLGGSLPHQGYVSEERAGLTNVYAHAAGNLPHEELGATRAEPKMPQSNPIDCSGLLVHTGGNGTSSLPLSLRKLTDADPPVDEIDGRLAFPQVQPGPSANARAAPKADGGVSKAERAGRRQSRRKPRTYANAVPSQYCHICSRRSTTISPHVVCGNVLQSRCRKAICTKCFETHNWDLEAARSAEAGSWLCTHCRGECPPRAQCEIYNRTSDRRRTKLRNPRIRSDASNARLDDGNMPPALRSSQSVGGNIVDGNTLRTGMPRPPTTFPLGSTTRETAVSAQVGQSGAEEIGSSERRSSGDAGLSNDGVGKGVSGGRNDGRIRKVRRNGGNESKVVLARVKKEIAHEVEKYNGDLQDMVRRGSAIFQRSDKDGATIPAVEARVAGSRVTAQDEVDGNCSIGSGRTGGLVAEKPDGDPVKASRVVLGQTGKSEVGKAACDTVDGQDKAESCSSLRSKKLDDELSTLAATLGADGGWNFESWLGKAEPVGVEVGCERGGDCDAADKPIPTAGTASKHREVTGINLEELVGASEAGGLDVVDVGVSLRPPSLL